MKPFLFSILLTLPGSGVPVISEFLASNGVNLTDEDGDTPDWIEIHNPDPTELDLGGYHLTDSGNLTKWTFPPGVTIPGDGYLRIFASTKDRAVVGANLHTNFSLSSSGEYLALVSPDGVTVLHDYAPGYPPQFEDRSFGLDGTTLSFFDNPTPGAANSAGTPAGPVIGEATRDPAQPVVGPLTVVANVRALQTPVASVTMFYRHMFSGEVALDMNDDGIAPDVTAGDGIYSASIPAAAVVPAEMVRWRFVATDSLGRTTLDPPFPDPVHSPKYWGTVGSDPGIESNLPTVHWFMSNPALANNTYPSGNPGAPGALYYLGQFYDNVGFKRHGQSTGSFPKKSYNIDFNKDHHFQWDPDQPRVSDIDLLTNWADKSKVRHVLAYEVMRGAGVHAHFAYTARVQQNGEFFSIADFVEDADETYLERAGLNKEGALYKAYDTTLNKDAGETAFTGLEKKTRKDEASRAELQALIDGLDLNGTALTRYQFDHLDLPKIINMLAAASVIRNTDMHRKNWYLYQDTGASNEWALLPWDLDLSFGRFWREPAQYFNNTLESNGFVQTGGAIRLVSQIYANPATSEMFYRRVRTLSDQFLQAPSTPVAERYLETRLNELSALMDDPSHAKSDAQLDFEKWGSWIHGQNGNQVSYSSPHGDVESMAEGVARLRNEYLPARRAFIYNTQTVASNGPIPLKQETTSAFNFTPLISTGDTVKYLVPSDASLGFSWIGFAEPFDDSNWSAGPSPLGYERNSGYENLIATDVDAEMTSNSSIYMRIPFTVENPAAFDSLELRMQYDDGFFAVLNGTILKSGNSPNSPVYNSRAEGSNEADINRFEIFDVTTNLGALKAGANILTIQGFNDSISSSDFLMNVELHGGAAFTVPPTNPTLEIGRIEVSPASGIQDEEYIEIRNPFAVAIDISNWQLRDAVDFDFQPGTVIPANSSLYVSPDVTVFRDRASSPTGNEGNFVQGPYSGHLSNLGETINLVEPGGILNATLSYVGSPSEAQQYLRISEIMYHPEPDGLAEFIELVNTSSSVTLDLTGVRFTEGVEFDFTGSGVTSLAPGARVLVIRNTASFEAVHGAGLPLAGSFTNATSLGNSNDRLKLEDADNNTILEFTYRDSAPWPTAPDAGYSLILINPASGPDPALAINWRASSAFGGTPGVEDGLALPADPLGDANNNGIPDLLDYSMGNDLASGPISLTLEHLAQTTDEGVVVLPTITYPQNLEADRAALIVEYSLDLSTWLPADDLLTTVGETDLGQGRKLFARYLNDPTATVYFRLISKVR
ncbi:lamin tail domain-containing protein [Verrucomicrobiaceae bacterium 227]